MPAPTNTSAATATVIASLPASITQDVHDAGTTYTVWYKYTAVTGDNVIGLWGFGDLVTYTPTSQVFLGPASAPVSYLGGVGAQNKPIQFPVTPGVTYFFRFTTNAGNPTPAVLTLTIEAHTDQTAPEGSLAINDDTSGFPLAILSATADEIVLRFVQDVVAGEAGDILPSGLLLLADASVAGQLKLYDATYAEIATVTSTGQDDVVTTNKLDTFYIVRTGSGGNNAIVTTVNTSGALGPTTWDLGTVGVIAACVNQAETILYYGKSGTNQPVKRWDLVLNAAMSDLVAGVDANTAFSAKDFLSFSDGSILVLYRNTTTSSSYAKHYSAAGATLHTYTFTYALSSSTDRLAYHTDETAFWVWLKGGAAATAVPTILKIQISDGTVLVTRTFTYYSIGAYRRTATATPTALFGHSSSCPFWLTRSSASPGPANQAYNGALGAELLPTELPPGGNGLCSHQPIVRLRRAPHLSDEQQRIFYKKFQLDLQAGQGTVTGQGIDPVLTLRWSNDGGFTWSPPRTLHCGALGEYRFRALAYQLGQARDRVFEVIQSDPVFSAWLMAYLELEEGQS